MALKQAASIARIMKTLEGSAPFQPPYQTRQLNSVAPETLRLQLWNLLRVSSFNENSSVEEES